MPIPITPRRPQAAKAAAAACLLAATIALGCIPTANAADMPTPVPTKAPEPPAYQWTGCYAGGNVGFGAAGVNFSTTVTPSTYLDPTDSNWVSASGSGSRNSTNFIGGGQVGCNYQVNTLVFGIEGDYDYFRANPNYNNNTNTLIDQAGTPVFAVAQSITTNYLATVRPRVGIAADRNLAYITGGVAFTRANYSESYTDGNGATGFASASKNLVGWVGGAGWEYAFTNNWIFRAEYLIAGFPGSLGAAGTITSGALSNPLQGSASGILIQVGRAGVEFKF
jgi:outer membrane immunogenic protein